MAFSELPFELRLRERLQRVFHLLFAILVEGTQKPLRPDSNAVTFDAVDDVVANRTSNAVKRDCSRPSALVGLCPAAACAVLDSDVLRAGLAVDQFRVWMARTVVDVVNADVSRSAVGVVASFETVV